MPSIILVITVINTLKKPLQPQLFTSRLNHHGSHFLHVLLRFLLELVVQHFLLRFAVFLHVFVYYLVRFILPEVLDHSYFFQVGEVWVLFLEGGELVAEVGVEGGDKGLLDGVAEVQSF